MRLLDARMLPGNNMPIHNEVPEGQRIDVEEFDAIVIGSGPAGDGAAMMAAKNHQSVAVKVSTG